MRNSTGPESIVPSAGRAVGGAGLRPAGADGGQGRQGAPPATTLRSLLAEDWPAVRAIYLDGIRSGLATFETEAPSWREWERSHTLRIVAERDDAVIGWAAAGPVSARRCYRGVLESSVYVSAAARGQGVGHALMRELIDRSEREGVWTIQTSIFPENEASLDLHAKLGFRLVGIRDRVGRRDGLWRNTVLMERRSEVIE